MKHFEKFSTDVNQVSNKKVQSSDSKTSPCFILGFLDMQAIQLCRTADRHKSVAVRDKATLFIPELILSWLEGFLAIAS